MMKLYDDVKIGVHDYSKYSCDYDKGYPCVICGRSLRNAYNVKMLRLVCGGKYITDSDRNFENDLGWFPVGNSCYKKFLGK